MKRSSGQIWRNTGFEQQRSVDMMSTFTGWRANTTHTVLDSKFHTAHVVHTGHRQPVHSSFCFGSSSDIRYIRETPKITTFSSLDKKKKNLSCKMDVVSTEHASAAGVFCYLAVLWSDFLSNQHNNSRGYWTKFGEWVWNTDSFRKSVFDCFVFCSCFCLFCFVFFLGGGGGRGLFSNTDPSSLDTCTPYFLHQLTSPMTMTRLLIRCLSSTWLESCMEMANAPFSGWTDFLQTMFSSKSSLIWFVRPMAVEIFQPPFSWKVCSTRK